MEFRRTVVKQFRRMVSWFFASKLALALLVLAVSAATIPITSRKYQAEIGGALNVTNSLVATDKGLSQATLGNAANGISCASPAIFGSVVASNTITALDFVYTVRVNETLTTTVGACFKATLVLTPSGASATTYGPLYMNTTAPSLVTKYVDCQFDIGSTGPSSPYSFQLTVQ